MRIPPGFSRAGGTGNSKGWHPKLLGGTLSADNDFYGQLAIEVLREEARQAVLNAPPDSLLYGLDPNGWMPDEVTLQRIQTLVYPRDYANENGMVNMMVDHLLNR